MLVPIGGGGFFQGDWFYTHWATDHPDLTDAHINLNFGTKFKRYL